MIAVKTNPVGIDKPISSLQTKLYTSLRSTWGITEAKYNSYGRCYRNEKDNGFIAEVFTGGKDYKEVYFDDTVSVVSFFGIGNETLVAQDGMMTANVHLLFFVNLKEIKPGAERNDEEARLDVQHILDTYGTAHGWLLTKQMIGIDKVLAEYPGTRRSIGLKYKDQQPLNCFRFDLQIFYQPTQIPC